MSGKRGHQSPPQELSAAQKRLQRELNLLQPFSWDKFKDKHPPNVAKMGIIPPAPVLKPTASPDDSSDSDTEDIHDARGNGLAASDPRETSPTMRYIVEKSRPASESIEKEVRSLVGAAVEATVTNGCGIAKRPRDDASGGSGQAAAVKKAKNDEKKKSRGRKSEPKQIPAAPIAPTAGGNLYALLRTSSRPPTSQGMQSPAATPAQTAAEAPAPAPATAAPAAAVPEPPSLPAMLALLQPLHDSGRGHGGLLGTYASCYVRMDAKQRAEQADGVRCFNSMGDMEALEFFLRGTVASVVADTVQPSGQ